MKNTRCPVQRGPRPNKSKEEFWRETLGQFATGGQTVRAFCRAHHLAEASFYAWRRSLARRDTARASMAEAAGAGPAFVPVHLTSALPGILEVVLAGGRSIRLHGPVDRVALAEVVGVLEALA